MPEPTVIPPPSDSDLSRDLVADHERLRRMVFVRPKASLLDIGTEAASTALPALRRAIAAEARVRELEEKILKLEEVSGATACDRCGTAVAAESSWHTCPAS